MSTDLTGQRRPLDPALFLAAFSGLLLAGAFPPFALGWLGFVALVPLLCVFERRPLACGFVCGLFFFAPLLYWLNIVMTSYGGLAPLLSVLAWLLLCTILATYFAVGCWLLALLQRRLGLSTLLGFPVIWVALEYLRSHLFTGFPWGLLGYAAIEMERLRQVADLGGVYGLSFLFALVNVALAGLLRRETRRSHGFGLVIGLALCAAGLVYGQQTVPRFQQQPTDLRVALLQGNIDQHRKWNPQFRQETLDRYRSLSLRAAAQGAELLIWPEAATPFYLQEDSPDSRQVLRLPLETGSALLVGSPSYEINPARNYVYRNSAYLLDRQGRFLGRSDKIHLVPFGEYVPLGQLLFFINKLVSGVGDFSPGILRPLPLDGHQLGVLICYEAIFPELARNYVKQGADLLVNLTNDAWFGRSSAPRQLLDMTRMRAIENRIWIARAANTGISALIGRDGRVWQQTPIFEAGLIVGAVDLGAATCYYRTVGDLLPEICLVLVGLGLLLVRLRRGISRPDRHAPLISD